MIGGACVVGGSSKIRLFAGKAFFSGVETWLGNTDCGRWTLADRDCVRLGECWLLACTAVWLVRIGGGGLPGSFPLSLLPAASRTLARIACSCSFVDNLPELPGAGTPGEALGETLIGACGV